MDSQDRGGRPVFVLNDSSLLAWMTSEIVFVGLKQIRLRMGASSSLFTTSKKNSDRKMATNIGHIDKTELSLSKYY